MPALWDERQMVRDARALRKTQDVADERLDLVAELYDLGISGWGPGVSTETLRGWRDNPATAPGRVPVATEQTGDSGAPRVRRGGEPASNQFGTFAVHQASPKQVAYLRRLLAQKDYVAKPEIVIPTDLDTISSKAASALIDRLLGCPDRTGTAGPVARLASDKQLGFLRKLIAERDYFSLVPADRAKVDYINGGGTPTSKGASELIDVLTKTALAPESQRPAAADPEIGMYRKADGTVYRVYPGRQSDRILAKRLVLPDRSLALGEKASFEYAGLASRFVTADERMTVEEAQAFGHQFGICCVCGALLTDPESVSNGIGPVCGKRV